MRTFVTSDAQEDTRFLATLVRVCHSILQQPQIRFAIALCMQHAVVLLFFVRAKTSNIAQRRKWSGIAQKGISGTKKEFASGTKLAKTLRISKARPNKLPNDLFRRVLWLLLLLLWLFLLLMLQI